MEQARFTYSPRGKIFEKQIKTIENHGKKQVEALAVLTLIQVKFLGVRNQVGGVKLHPPHPHKSKTHQKFELWYLHTHPYVVLENVSFSTKTLLILLMSALFYKKSIFFNHFFNRTFTKSNSVRAVLEILQLCFHFLQVKRLLLMKR